MYVCEYNKFEQNLLVGVAGGYQRICIPGHKAANLSALLWGILVYVGGKRLRTPNVYIHICVHARVDVTSLVEQQ